MSFALVGDRKDIQAEKLCTHHGITPRGKYFPTSTPLSSVSSLLSDKDMEGGMVVQGVWRERVQLTQVHLDGQSADPV